MSIKALHDSILFVFDDEVAGAAFNNKTESGIIYKSFDTDLETSRWATVLTVGDEVKEIRQGDSILIEKLKWTEGCKMPDGIKIWRTTEEHVMCVKEK